MISVRKKKRLLKSIVLAAVILAFATLASGCTPWWAKSGNTTSSGSSRLQTTIEDPNLSQYVGDKNLQKYEAAAKANPTNFKDQINAGMSAYANKKYDEAISYYNAASKVEPNNPEPVNALGNIYFRNLNQPEKALGLYQQATKLNPSYAYAWWNEATCQKALGNIGDAKATLQKGLANVSKSDPLYSTLQKMLSQLS